MQSPCPPSDSSPDLPAGGAPTFGAEAARCGGCAGVVPPLHAPRERRASHGPTHTGIQNLTGGLGFFFYEYLPIDRDSNRLSSGAEGPPRTRGAWASWFGVHCEREALGAEGAVEAPVRGAVADQELGGGE
eukprot:3908129-Prymnesium_polylepis.1